MSMGTFYALCGRTSSRNSIICSKHTFCGCEIRSDVASPHSWIPCVARITRTPCFLVMFVSVRVPRVPSKSPVMCFLTVWSSLFHVMSVVLNRHKPWLSKPHTYWPLGIWNEYNFSSLWFRDFPSSFSLSLFMTAASRFYTAAHSEMKLFILNLFAAQIITFLILSGFQFVFFGCFFCQHSEEIVFSL